MDIPCISIGVDIHGISMDIPCISTKYRHGISMDIRGISFDLYTWNIHGISMDTPSFLKPDFAAGPCCWSHSMRTRVWVIDSVLFHAPPWQLCQGKRLPTKGRRQPSPLSLAAVVTAAAAVVSCGRGCLSVILVLSRATTWILVRDGGEGASEQVTNVPNSLDACLCWKSHPSCKGFRIGLDHVLVMNLKDWVECSLQINWILNSELSFSSDQKTANTWEYRVTIRTIWYWY